MVEIFQFQNLVLSLLSFAMIGVKAFALIDASTRPASIFVHAEKQTKNLWLLLLGLALVANILLPQPIGILNLAGIVAAFVYLADVRPALRELTPPRR